MFATGLGGSGGGKVVEEVEERRRRCCTLGVTLFMMISGKGYFCPLLFGPQTHRRETASRPLGNRSVIIIIRVRERIFFALRWPPRRRFRALPARSRNARK